MLQLVCRHILLSQHALLLAGWVALAAVCAAVVLGAAIAVFAYRRFTGANRPYTLLVKAGDV